MGDPSEEGEMMRNLVLVSGLCLVIYVIAPQCLAEGLQRIKDPDGKETFKVAGEMGGGKTLAVAWTPLDALNLTVTVSLLPGGGQLDFSCSKLILFSGFRGRSSGEVVRRGASLVGLVPLDRESLAGANYTLEICGDRLPLPSSLGQDLQGMGKAIASNVATPLPAPIIVKAASPQASLPCAGIGVKREEDRFTGHVSATASGPVGIREYKPILIWSSERPDSLVFEVIGSNESWRYLSCHTLNLLANGMRVPIDKVTHQGQVERGYVIEIIGGTIQWDAAQPLTNANKVEYRLCNDEDLLTQQLTCQVQAVMRVAAEWRASHLKAN
jgi:hypothetical protein